MGHQRKEIISRVSSQLKKGTLYCAPTELEVELAASTPFLAQLLGKIGLQVKEIYLYDVCAFKDITQWNEFRKLFSSNIVDEIIFTSASSVDAFFEIMLMDSDEKKLLENLSKLKVVAIGPFTAEELKKFGTSPVIADVHTVMGAFETVKNCFN